MALEMTWVLTVVPWGDGEKSGAAVRGSALPRLGEVDGLKRRDIAEVRPGKVRDG